jgi:dTMP kinase
LLVQGERDRWDPQTETLLVFAARADHVARAIQPALAEGRWVICDRFIDSTYAYQGAGRGTPIEFIKTLQGLVLNGFMPDLTLILDIDPQAGLARTSQRTHDETRFERFDKSFHIQLREAFRAIAATQSKRCVLINASRSEAEVEQSIWRAVSTRLGL